MAAIQIFPLEVWTSQITQASIPANNNALRVQVLEAPAIAIQSTPPATPAEDDMYIVDSGSTGAWASFVAGNVVIYKGGTWLEFEKFTGWIKTVGTDAYLYNGTSWVVFAVGPSAEPWTYLYLASDFSHDTNSYVDVTGLTFSVDSNSKYSVEIFCAYQSTAVGTGVGLIANGPVDSDVIGQIIGLASTTGTTGTEQYDYSANINTAGVPAANRNTSLKAEYLISTTSPGNVQIKLRSETNGQTITLKSALFYVRYRKLP